MMVRILMKVILLLLLLVVVVVVVVVVDEDGDDGVSACVMVSLSAWHCPQRTRRPCRKTFRARAHKHTYSISFPNPPGTYYIGY